MPIPSHCFRVVALVDVDESLEVDDWVEYFAEICCIGPCQPRLSANCRWPNAKELTTCSDPIPWARMPPYNGVKLKFDIIYKITSTAHVLICIGE